MPMSTTTTYYSPAPTHSLPSPVSFQVVETASQHERSGAQHPPQSRQYTHVSFMKGPKRKRLAKACDGCHKSKRRCDGTAPCGNCQWANKPCSYTDQNGRPVPAPRSGNATKPPYNVNENDTASSEISNPNTTPNVSQYTNANGAHHPSSTTYSASVPSSSGHNSLQSYEQDRHANFRKRPRTDSSHGMGDLTLQPSPVSPLTAPPRQPFEVEPALLHELTNLFFTHCHPARIIFQRPEFSSAMTKNQVPKYLLYAICAVAAPLSKQQAVRTNPPRHAGREFAQEAQSLLFDGAGRLLQCQSLEAAQALCLLQIHEMIAEEVLPSPTGRYHSLSLQIIEALGAFDADHARLTPMANPAYIQAQIQRECLRRIFWLIHFLDLMASIYHRRAPTISDHHLLIRLPVDETSFEFGNHNTLPEYLQLNPIKMQYASEFGHLIRVVTIYVRIEEALGSPSQETRSHMLSEAERKVSEWQAYLTKELAWSKDQLAVKQSMLETGSSTGAWCWCCMHVYHASCILALSEARHGSGTNFAGSQDSASKIDSILKILGDRAKYSLILGCALWPLIRYCRRDDQHIDKMCAALRDYFGIDMKDCAIPESTSSSSYHMSTRPKNSYSDGSEPMTHSPSHSQHHPSEGDFNSDSDSDNERVSPGSGVDSQHRLTPPYSSRSMEFLMPHSKHNGMNEDIVGRLLSRPPDHLDTSSEPESGDSSEQSLPSLRNLLNTTYPRNGGVPTKLPSMTSPTRSSPPQRMSSTPPGFGPENTLANKGGPRSSLSWIIRDR